jgi:hypothetical protein
MVTLVPLVLEATGCTKERPLPPELVATSAVTAASSSPSSSAAPRRPAASASATPLSATAQKAITGALRSGQTHVREKRWAEAARAYEEALTLSPTDGSTLCELGFVAWKAGDYTKAEAANLRALTFVHEPNLRAKVLFNQGLVHESKGQKAEAAKRFEESLALRANATVEKHLRDIDKDKVVKAPEPEKVPCPRSFRSVAEACTCLVDDAKGDPAAALPDNPILCTPEKTRTSDDELTTLKVGPEMLGERIHYAIAKTKDGFTPVAVLGRDFEPGAFGVHNEATVKGIETRELDGRKVFVIRSEQSNFDQNMAGLEQYQDVTQLVTYCLAKTPTEGPRCPVQAPTDIHSTLAYPDFDEMSAEDKKEQKERRKGAYDRRVLLAHTLLGGAVAVKLTKGSAKDVAPAVIGTHKLF